MDRANPHEMSVAVLGGQRVIRVPGGRAEELRIHLASHGIHARLSTVTTGPEYEVLLVEGDVDPVTLQALLDEWEK